MWVKIEPNKRVFMIICITVLVIILNFRNCWAIDGHFWSKISSQEKQAYLTGFIDGAMCLNAEIIISIDKDHLCKAKIDDIPDKYDLKDQFTVLEVVEGINRFYSDYANKQIDFSDALKIVLKRLRGASEIELQNEIEYLRKFYSNFKDKKK